MIVMLVALWLALGFATLIWNSYLEESPFEDEISEFPLTLVVLLGGFSFFWLVVKSVYCASWDAGEKRRLAAAERERELAAARRELDEMLRKERAP